MVDRSLVENRRLAQRLIMAGQVVVDGEVAVKPSRLVEVGASISLKGGPPFVSRGGEKLDHAMQVFEISARERICADVGASTGGFTDCLLQRGAARVYAIDVGYGQLHWRLRNHPRVVVMERTNARYLERLPETVGLVTIDVSFISLELIFPLVRRWLAPGGEVVALVKPQFEAARREVGKGGVVRDRRVHQAVVRGVASAAREHQLSPRGIIQSPLRGPKGNLEYLMWCRLDGGALDLDALTSDLFQAH